MTIRIAILAACVGTLALAASVVHAAPGDPITGIVIGLEHCPPGDCMAICGKKTCKGTNTNSAQPKTQKQKAGSGRTTSPVRGTLSKASR
jgi:hypothetical protein